MSLRHLVFLWLNDKADIQKIEKNLTDVVKLISGIRAFHFGKCEEATNRYNYAFFIDFENEEGRKQYLEHEAHQRLAREVIIPQLAGAIENSVLVFDYQKKNKPTTTVNYISDMQPTKGYFLARAGAGAIDTNAFSQIAAENKKLLKNCTVEDLSWNFNSALRIKINSPSASQTTQQSADTLFVKMFHKKVSLMGASSDKLPAATPPVRLST
jgi:hypothetical protein